MPKIVCLADLHCMQEEVVLPLGDICCIAGDMTWEGKLEELNKFNQWIERLPYKHVVCTPGNHDCLFEKDPGLAKSLFPKAICLIDQEVTIEGLRFWGSPWSPEFYNWAFNVPRGKLSRYWDLIPEGIDVLITHCPPRGIGDYSDYSHQHVGCAELESAVARVKPKRHLFGHTHNGHGVYLGQHTTFINCSVVNSKYDVVFEPIVTEVA